MYVIRLTKAQLNIVWSCVVYATTGEIAGGPLCGLSEDDAETRRNLKVYDRAVAALRNAKQE